MNFLTCKENGKIEPERAELLKRQIIGSIEKFSDAGVTITEIDARTVFNPRQLMRPQRKLLVAPPKKLSAVDQKHGKYDDLEGPELDDQEFQKHMEEKQFLKKRNKKKDKRVQGAIT